MPGPLSLLPALVAVAAAAATTAGVATPAVAAPPAAPAAWAPAAAVEEEQDPLQVTLEELTPGEIPDRGPLRMRGQVTNVSDEPWRTVNVYAFVGFAPMTTAAELEQAREVPAATEVGQRIFTPGTFDGIGDLEPGESASYEVVLRRDEIPAELPGVYWFGAHALGTAPDASSSDGVADGRARTFLPLLPGGRGQVETSLLLPLRHRVQHTPQGRVAGEPGWAADLAPAGTLDRVLDLGEAAGRRPFGWLLDPAVPDAVTHLAGGNATRSLGDTVEPGPEEPGDPGEDPSEEETGSTEAAADVLPTGVAREAARDWLDRLPEALDRGRVLALPYGDLDVSGAVDHAPDLLRAARDRAEGRVPGTDVPTLPAVAPPQGYLSSEALAALPYGTHTVLGDRMLSGTPATGEVEGTEATEEADGETAVEPPGGDGPVTVDDRRVLFADEDVALGGPGPDDPLGGVALRQRILAQAAVRRLEQPRNPLVVVLPQGWAPEQPRAFWRGLSVPWMALTDPTSLTSGREVAAERLDYPAEQRAAEVPATTFTTAQSAVQAGEVLARVLTNNDQIGDDVLDEALSALSYAARTRPEQQQRQLERLLGWVERRTQAVRVDAPPGVTLSSATGKFGATLTNRLDHPVTISLDAVTDPALAVDTPATIELAPRGSQGVFLDARATTPGVHYVQLVVTDDTGAPLGSSARLPVRSAQVSQVIWLILGVGVGLLFLAITVRLLRRIRSERA